MDTYELSNYDRILRFSGERIGHATSRAGRDIDQLRWTEVDIYLSTSGHYVLHKIGKSRVYHAGPQMCSGNGGKLTTANAVRTTWDEAKVKDLEWCPVCKPDDIATFNGPVKVEVDRGIAVTSTTAAGIVESAYAADSDGVMYLTKTAERALREAATVDDNIRDAFMVETI